MRRGGRGPVASGAEEGRSSAAEDAAEAGEAERLRECESFNSARDGRTGEIEEEGLVAPESATAEIGLGRRLALAPPATCPREGGQPGGTALGSLSSKLYPRLLAAPPMGRSSDAEEEIGPSPEAEATRERGGDDDGDGAGESSA